MDRPLEIAFHGLESSAAIEEDIRSHVHRLTKRFPQLIACRVSVEALHHQHRSGNIHEVHITLSIQGRDLAVSREPKQEPGRFAHPDLRGSIRDAFNAAERQLMALKSQRRQDTMAPSASAVTGQITLVEPGQDHGFLLTNLGTQLYFHRDSVTNGRFEDLKPGDVVHYVEAPGDTGPVAEKVRVKAE